MTRDQNSNRTMGVPRRQRPASSESGRRRQPPRSPGAKRDPQTRPARQFISWRGIWRRSPQPQPAPTRRRQWSLTNFFLWWLHKWPLTMTLALLLTSSAGVLAGAYLLRIPGLPNCPAIFWPLAPASVRFECARIAASKQTANDLLEAIELLNSLPQDHPLREEADRLIEVWSEEVLRLADTIFQDGNLAEAIAAARRIPVQTKAYELVEEQINKWETIWQKAETIWQKAETELKQRDYRRAFDHATDLLFIENKFWKTQKYDELIALINVARADGKKLYRAERLARSGTLDNLIEAIKVARSIKPESYIYGEAQTAIIQFGRQMIGVAEFLLDQQDLALARKALANVPKVGSLENEVLDMTILATAYSHSWKDSVAGLEDAISHAQRIDSGRPLYQKAQNLIARWQYEIEGLAQLNKARGMAASGNVNDLRTAISEAAQVSANNPRRRQVDEEIATWERRIQTIEDQPYLDAANQLAAQGGIDGLLAAIEQAQQIRAGRALYTEARTKIQQWQREIQRIRNQPYLDQARQLANQGNLPAAIQVAQQIPPGQALSREARSDIQRWQQTLRDRAVTSQSQVLLQEARQTAQLNTPDAVTSAMQIARRAASAGTPGADQLIQQLSWQLYQLATDRANYDLSGGIAIAQKIPAGTPAYAEAQAQIQKWRSMIEQMQPN